MEVFLVFVIGFSFSFMGSIPPGTINISVIQLALSGDQKAALRFALAAAIVEYPYALIAVKFEALLTESPYITKNFQLIAAIVMTTLGLINIFASENPTGIVEKLNRSGFRKGVAISILNPLAIPFWLGVTAYLKSTGLLSLSSSCALHSYILGISLGTFVLLAIIALLSEKISFKFQKNILLKRLPGIIFLSLGLYSLFNIAIKG